MKNLEFKSPHKASDELDCTCRTEQVLEGNLLTERNKIMKSRWDQKFCAEASALARASNF